MQKADLIATAEIWEQEAKENNLMGYPRENKEKIAEISAAIIKIMCETDGLTMFIAKNALKMAEEIFTHKMEHDVIL